MNPIENSVAENASRDDPGVAPEGAWCQDAQTSTRHTVDTVRKIILMLSMSVDGYFEGPGRELDWHQVDDELHQHFNEVLARMSIFIDGRVNYELMAGYWPHADEDPNASAPEREMPKIVYSRTLQHAEWNATLRREVDPDEIRALKQQPGGDMVVGGANLAATFTHYGLIDEYHIYMQPVVLGAGHPLFPPAETRLLLTLVDTRRFGNGVVLLNYAPRTA
jgi:dihydrofolate reductase